jgi:hypothetical protein
MRKWPARRAKATVMTMGPGMYVLIGVVVAWLLWEFLGLGHLFGALWLAITGKDRRD